MAGAAIWISCRSISRNRTLINLPPSHNFCQAIENLMISSPFILITGATGFIGGTALTHLLLSHRNCRLLLFVRADSPSVALSRIETSISRFIDLAVVKESLRYCEFICGDLTDRKVYDDPRLDKVTHVLHLAANTSFRSVRAVRHTNILGTLTLVHRMRRASCLQRFLYVGTAYICGTNPPRIVREQNYPQFQNRHLVEYTNSKAECELLLENTAPELPLIVARPSVVIGHTQLGCLPSASIFWFYKCVDALRQINCSMDMMNDVIPVDYAADALLLLLLKTDLKYKRYHISAGMGSSVTWHEIAIAFAKYYKRQAIPYQQVDFETITGERERLQGLLGPGDENHLLNALKIYYRFCETTAEIFDNQRLLDEGMPQPPKFTDYLQICAALPSDRSIYEQMLDDE
jgi:nucleoside-diphosphate-sugar epimerase